MIVSSESRGSAILAVGGVAAIILPNVSRPSVVTLLLAVIPFGLFLFATSVSDSDQDIGLGASRFTGEESRKDTHIDYWRHYLQIHHEAEASLFCGKGWCNFRGRASTAASAYLQLFLEMRLLNALWFIYMMLRFIYRAWQHVGQAGSKHDLEQDYAWSH